MAHATKPSQMQTHNTQIPSLLDLIQNAQNSHQAFKTLTQWSLQPPSYMVAHELEQEIFQAGMELLRLLLQETFQAKGPGFVGKALYREGDQKRLSHKRSHSRNYESLFGTIQIERLGYGARAEPSIHPLDQQLSLPQGKYSYPLQLRALRQVARGPYDQAMQSVEESTAGHIPKLQLQQIAKEAAGSFEGFYKQRSLRAESLKQSGPILVAGIDCKGVPRRKTAEEKLPQPKGPLNNTEGQRKKKMATVASVHTTKPYKRTPEELTARLLDLEPEPATEKRPKAENRRLWASVMKSKDEVYEEIVEELKKRDPNRDKTVVCLTDGERALQNRAQSQIKAHFPSMILILDLIHALGYLWQAAHAFCEPGSEQARLWVRRHLLGLLSGKVSQVAAAIRQSATRRGLEGNKRKEVDQACNYLLKNKEYMKYDEYLELGLPVASGMVEGACGHLVKDRMELTGAIWTLEGAEAVLKLRAVEKSGDMEEFWGFHMNREHEWLYDLVWWPAAA